MINIRNNSLTQVQPFILCDEQRMRGSQVYFLGHTGPLIYIFNKQNQIIKQIIKQKKQININRQRNNLHILIDQFYKQ